MTHESLERLHSVTVGGIEQRDIVLVDHDPAWHDRFAVESRRIAARLGATALAIEHVGSTAVCGLAAKPIIDILLMVPDPSVEATYVPQLEGAGYGLRIREPEFFEHRMLRTSDRDVHVHVFGPDADEVDRMLTFRDTVRADLWARRRYEQVKRDLVRRQWPTMQHYADAKSAIIDDILSDTSAPPRSRSV